MMATRYNKAPRVRPASGSVFRLLALALLIAQLGLVAHRIEHYITPDHMECGEDACMAFAPTPGAAPALEFVAPLILVVFFVSFTCALAPFSRRRADRLGFMAHAPPV